MAPSGPGYIPFAVETSAGLLHHEQFTQEFRVLTNGDGPLQDTTVSTQRNNAEAVFGSVSYTVIGPLKLTAGVRYTHDARKFMLDYSNTVPPPSPPNCASGMPSRRRARRPRSDRPHGWRGTC